MKVEFTKSLSRAGDAIGVRRPDSASRQKHRESDVWQRRFWEHTIDGEDEFEAYLDYVHYNPVKHGLVSSVRDWRFSSFHRYVHLGMLAADFLTVNQP